MDKFTKTIGIFGGAAILFYVLGFTIVRTFIHNLGLEGMFWLTREYYIDAGAIFLLEMIRAPLQTPYIFFTYFLLLYLLVPKEKRLCFLPSEESQASPEVKPRLRYQQWFQLGTLLAITIATCLFATSYNDLQSQKWFMEGIDLIIVDPTERDFTFGKNSALFFSLITPLVIAGGIFIYRLWTASRQGRIIKYINHTASIVYVIFLAIIPVSYGSNIYNWKMVPVEDNQIVQEVFNLNENNPPTNGVVHPSAVWLLGQFQDKYIFATKSDEDQSTIIEVVDVDMLKRLRFNPTKVEFFSFVYEQSSVADMTTKVDSITPREKALRGITGQNTNEK